MPDFSSGKRAARKSVTVEERSRRRIKAARAAVFDHMILLLEHLFLRFCMLFPYIFQKENEGSF